MHTISPAAFFAALLCWATAALAGVDVTATADRTRVALGEQVVVTLKVVSDKALPNVPAPALPPDESYTVVRTSRNQSQSSSVQIVNGKMTQTVEITYFTYYQLAPQKAGTFTFPALQLVVDGQAYATQPFDIVVTKEPVENPEVKVRILLSKAQPYAGEQVVLTLQVAKKAQSPAQLTEQGFAECIDRIEKSFGKDFSVSRLFTQFPKGIAERIDGEFYHVFKLNWAVFPLNAGAVSVPPVSMEYIVNMRVQRRNVDPFFGDFFGGGVQQVAKSAVSNGIALKVRQLPPPPADFSGAVGKFGLAASADPRTIPAGEAVTLKLALSGNTRPGSLNDPRMPRMEEFEVFPPEKQTGVDTTAGGIVSRKTYKYLVIPRREGNLPIPPVTWTYFDPAVQAYKTLSTDSIRLEVTKGKTSPKSAARYLTQADIREVGRDIRYIKTTTEVGNQPQKPYLNPLFFILYPLPFLTALFSFLYRLQATRQKDIVVSLRRRALGHAFREVQQLRKHASAMSGTDFLSRIAVVIEHYISNKFAFPATGRTLEELRQELSTKGVDAQVVSELVSFVEGLDRYRFGGIALDDKGKTDALTRTSDFIAKLEKAYRKESRR